MMNGGVSPKRYTTIHRLVILHSSFPLNSHPKEAAASVAGGLKLFQTGNSLPEVAGGDKTVEFDAYRSTRADRPGALQGSKTSTSEPLVDL